MAKTFTLTVNYDGSPLNGAEIITSAAQTIQITDVNGQISASTPDNYATAILFAVRHANLTDSIAFAVMVLEAGNNYVLDIPNKGDMEVEFMGLHSLKAQKV